MAEKLLTEMSTKRYLQRVSNDDKMAYSRVELACMVMKSRGLTEYWALVDPDLLLKHLTVAHTDIDRAPGSRTGNMCLPYVHSY